MLSDLRKQKFPWIHLLATVITAELYKGGGITR